MVSFIGDLFFEVFPEHTQSRLYYRWFDVFFQENIKIINLPLVYVAEKYDFNGNLNDRMRKNTKKLVVR